MEFDRARLMNNINTLIKDKNIKIGELENSIGISTGYLSKMSKADNESMPGIDMETGTETGNKCRHACRRRFWTFQ